MDFQWELVIHPVSSSFKFSSSAFDQFFLFEEFKFGDNGSRSAVVFGSDAVNAVKGYVVDGVVWQFQR